MSLNRWSQRPCPLRSGFAIVIRRLKTSIAPPDPLRVQPDPGRSQRSRCAASREGPEHSPRRNRPQRKPPGERPAAGLWLYDAWNESIVSLSIDQTPPKLLITVINTGKKP